MRGSIREYLTFVKRRYQGLLSGAILGLFGLITLKWNLLIPTWAWILAAILSLAWTQFAAFHDVRVERDRARDERDEARQELDSALAAPQQVGILLQGHDNQAHHNMTFFASELGDRIGNEHQRRTMLLRRIFDELMESSDRAIADGARNGLLPNEVVERRLEELGETWRQPSYNPVHAMPPRPDEVGG